MTTPHKICAVSELPPGDRRIVEIEGRSIGVFNIDGEFYALTNVCPHQRAPLCEGELTGTTEAEGVEDVEWACDGRILRCPWHGWEFDATTGESVFNPHRWRVSTYETDVLVNSTDDPCDLAIETYSVKAENGAVFVYL